MTPTPICSGCGKQPHQLSEYVELAKDNNMNVADLKQQAHEFMMQEEGTYNQKNGRFYCTQCYINIGMPSSEGGWHAP